MKIKELHLRNIASIEKADIDFENDVTDCDTHEPANIFLISGDTGTGKSVILDGISMALYKTTPRIEDVTNQRSNRFYDEQGELISINSIEQYTRLGISDKDECYSELVFVGNDDVEYRAKLKLGYYMTRKLKDKERHLKYNTPSWTVKVGDADWTNVESNGQPILGAIGLSFSQFSRMAMLAQGQFAAFLTGTKDERERILEQLTNTEKFTIYGKAIHNLFQRAKESKNIAEHFYSVQQGNLLQPEKEQELRDQMAIQDTKNSSIKQRLEQVQGTIALIESLSDWQTKKQNAQSHLEGLKATFRQLSADLAYRDIKMSESRKREEALTAWVNERKALDEVYSKADTIVYQLKQFVRTCEGIKSAEGELQDAKGKTTGLADALKACEEAVNKAQKDVDEKQKSIDALLKEYNDLDPNSIVKVIKSRTDRKTSLSNLKLRIVKTETERGKAVAVRDEIQQEDQRLEKQGKELDGLKREYESANKVATEVRSLLTTMQLSVKETLTELRKRLQHDHADICPLCGQPLEHLHLDQEFHDMLTPLELKEKEANELLKVATTSYNSAKTKYDTDSGILKEKQKSYDKLIKDIAKEDESIMANAASMGLDVTQPIAIQIDAAILLASEAINMLEAKQNRAQDIQGWINQLTTDKKPLDRNLTIANRNLSDARSAVVANARDISKLAETIDERNRTKDTLMQELTLCLGVAYPLWSTDTANVIQQFASAAREYCDNKRNAETQRNRNEVEEQSLSHVRKIRKSILEGRSEWDSEVEPQPAVRGDASSDWTRLYSSVNHEDEAIREAMAKISVLLTELKVETVDAVPAKEPLVAECNELLLTQRELNESKGAICSQLEINERNKEQVQRTKAEFDKASATYDKWERIDRYFGSMRFRTLVQTYILRPLLNNANVYLERITDRYTLTCHEENEQLAILVLDRYNKNQVRSVTVLSGGERFMISLALSLALSTLNRPDMNINILFIDEGFGTLDETSLNSVMSTLERLQDIAGQTSRRVGIISHREELAERIPVKINVRRRGEGRSVVDITNS